MWESKYIEFPLLLAHFGGTLSGSVDTNFIIYRTCTAILGCNETDCAKLGSGHQDNSTRGLEERVQPYANVITMCMMISGHILPALVCLFLGHWSDKNGRKPILLSSMIGHVCTSIIKIVISSMPSVSPWYLVLQVIPTILSGGFVTFHMVCFCYLTETTKEENRSMRMGALEVIFGFAIIAGTSSSSYIFEAVGYPILYAIGAMLETVAILFMYFFLKESVVITDRVKLSQIFAWKHVQVMIDTVRKVRREKYARTILLLLMVSMAVYKCAHSDGHIMFQFVRVQFGWDLRKFTFLLTWYFILHAIAMFIGMVIMQRLMKVPDSAMLILGYSGSIASLVFTLKATEDWYIYTAAGIKSACSIITPIVRSMISKIVETEEVGKIFALLMAVESLCGIASTAIFTIIYNETLTTYPAAFMFLALFLYIVELVIMFFVLALMSKQKKNKVSATMTFVKEKEGVQQGNGIILQEKEILPQEKHTVPPEKEIVQEKVADSEK